MKSDYERNRLLSLRYGDNSPAYARSATLYLGLHTAAFIPGTPGAEVVGGSYARQAVTNNGTNFPDPVTPGIISLGIAIPFPIASALWGTLTWFAWWDAISGGNWLDAAALTTPRTVTTGDLFTMGAGQITWTET